MRFFGSLLLLFVANQYVGVLQAAENEVENQYVKYCSVCHGRSGDGRGTVAGLTPPPRNFTTEVLPRERMIKSIADGRTGTAMSAYGKKLSRAEIEGLVDYIRKDFMRVTASQQADLDEKRNYRELGRSLYEHNCSVCHGDQGGSGVWSQSGLQPPPRDFTAPIARQELLARERMVFSVTNGRSGTAMMPFGNRLSKHEIDAVIDYIRAEFMGLEAHDEEIKAQARAQEARSNTAVPAERPPHHGHAADMGERQIHAAPASAEGAGLAHSRNFAQLEADMTLPMPKGLKGKVEQGRKFFMSNCFTCHGKKGDGNGPRAYFINPRPRNFTNDLSRLTLNRPALFKAISEGKPRTVMPAWGKVLTDQQVSNVAEFVFQTFIRPDAQ